MPRSRVACHADAQQYARPPPAHSRPRLLQAQPPRLPQGAARAGAGRVGAGRPASRLRHKLSTRVGAGHGGMGGAMRMKARTHSTQRLSELVVMKGKGKGGRKKDKSEAQDQMEQRAAGRHGTERQAGRGPHVGGARRAHGACLSLACPMVGLCAWLGTTQR